MKSALYINYPVRSLLRGGLRTTMAVFCITVGVMAVVSLQLVGFMMQSSLTTSARVVNGGDIAVTAQGAPLNASDLNFFDTLKNAGTIANYTAVSQVNGTLDSATSAAHAFNLEAVDPQHFPLVSQPEFVDPSNGTIAQILQANQVIVTQNFLATYGKQMGDTFNVYVKTTVGAGETLNVKIAGAIANTGQFVQSANLLLISIHDYLASAPASLANYTLVNITTSNQTHTTTAVKAISQQFQLASIQTASDLLNAEKSSIDMLSTFLKIAGLLALLIGGVGIINTMQVLLSRRKKEIAMLKTSGYRRGNLILLFGLETGILGLSGGIAGAVAATGVSYLVRGLIQTLGNNIPFVLNTGTLLGGIFIGFLTSLIFGLLPIIQAANIRPLQVLREFEKKSLGGIILTIFLFGLVSILFCVLATTILDNNLALGISVTYNACIALLLIGGVFSLLILGISKLPVPEGLQLTHILLIGLGIAVALAAYTFVPIFGVLLMIATLLGIVVAFLPSQAKVNVKMALRNLGRQRARTTATLLALFIGVFGIAIDIGVGQDLGTLISNALSQNSPYNLVATTVGQDANKLLGNLNRITGLSSSRTDPFVTTRPVEINGQSMQQLLPAGAFGQQVLNNLGGIEGYDLAQTIPAQTITQGRNLNAKDAHTNNVLVSQIMTSKGWDGLKIKVGDTITLTSLDNKMTKTVTVVGIISVPTSFETLGEVLAPAALVNDFNSTVNKKTTVFYMKIAPAQLNQALIDLNRIVPNASVQNLSNSAVSFMQQVTSLLDVVLAVAGLSLLAGIIIIANSVALAMLERRRELGILKAVGYTSGTILKQVLIEYGIIGGIGSSIATLLAAGGVTLGSKFYFNNNLTLNMEPLIVTLMIAGPVLLAVLTAVLVAWNAVRVRPLEVLRYE